MFLVGGPNHGEYVTKRFSDDLIIVPVYKRGSISVSEISDLTLREVTYEKKAYRLKRLESGYCYLFEDIDEKQGEMMLLSMLRKIRRTPRKSLLFVADILEERGDDAYKWIRDLVKESY